MRKNEPSGPICKDCSDNAGGLLIKAGIGPMTSLPDHAQAFYAKFALSEIAETSVRNAASRAQGNEQAATLSMASLVLFHPQNAGLWRYLTDSSEVERFQLLLEKDPRRVSKIIDLAELGVALGKTHERFYRNMARLNDCLNKNMYSTYLVHTKGSLLVINNDTGFFNVLAALFGQNEVLRPVEEYRLVVDFAKSIRDGRADAIHTARGLEYAKILSWPLGGSGGQESVDVKSTKSGHSSLTYSSQQEVSSFSVSHRSIQSNHHQQAPLMPNIYSSSSSSSSSFSASSDSDKVLSEPLPFSSSKSEESEKGMSKSKSMILVNKRLQRVKSLDV